MSGKIQSKKFLASRRVFVERVGEFLRKRHPYKTADNVAAETGITVYSVAKWLSNSTCPNGPSFAVMTYVYGREFLKAVFVEAPTWLDEPTVDHMIAELNMGIEARRLEIERLTR